jgi:signal-induced proliferation-associated 1 like protein 3
VPIEPEPVVDEVPVLRRDRRVPLVLPLVPVEPVPVPELSIEVPVEPVPDWSMLVPIEPEVPVPLVPVLPEPVVELPVLVPEPLVPVVLLPEVVPVFWAIRAVPVARARTIENVKICRFISNS